MFTKLLRLLNYRLPTICHSMVVKQTVLQYLLIILILNTKQIDFVFMEFGIKFHVFVGSCNRTADPKNEHSHINITSTYSVTKVQTSPVRWFWRRSPRWILEEGGNVEPWLHITHTLPWCYHAPTFSRFCAILHVDFGTKPIEREKYKDTLKYYQ